MILYVIRHAHAEHAGEDAARPLSSRGREQVRALAVFLKRSGVLQVSEVWHSGLVRSLATAEQLVQGLGLDATLVQVDGLISDADPQIVAQGLRTRREPLAVVGHEPHLSALASLLITGAAAPARFVLQKSSVLALEGVDRHWAVRWQISPELLTQPAP